MDRPADGIHDLVTRLREGDGHAPAGLRRAAFDGTAPDVRVRALVAKVGRDAAAVTDDDLDTARAAGLTEDQIWEVTVCAAVGQASREYAAGRAALGDALADRTADGRPS